MKLHIKVSQFIACKYINCIRFLSGYFRKSRRCLAYCLILSYALPFTPIWANEVNLQQDTVEVLGFEIAGNSLLTNTVLQRVLEPFKGRVTVDDLKIAAQTVQKRYVAQGFGGVIAYVPIQNRSDGIVTITVLEGKLSRIDVVGSKTGNTDGAQNDLTALKIGATPHLGTVDLQLQMINENPSKRAQVLLKPGLARGEIAAEVGIEEGPKNRMTLGLDNTGNVRTGHYRTSATFQNSNISGLDDVLTVFYQTSPTHPRMTTVLTGAYRLPFYSKLTFLDAYVAYSNIDGGGSATAAGDLQFSGKGNSVGLRASNLLPRWVETDQRLSLGFDYREYLNRCDLIGLPTGACGSAGESVAVQPLSLEYSAQKGGVMPLGFLISINRNIKMGGRHSSGDDFEAVRLGANPRYTVLRTSFFSAIPTVENWQLRGRLLGQYSVSALVPGEQFGLAGATSVRGYEEREMTGDSGLLGSIELTTPPLFDIPKQGDPMVQLIGFIDAGRVINRNNTPCLGSSTRCNLVSWGAGSRMEWSGVQARLFLAVPSRDATRTVKGSLRVHFSANYAF